LPCAGAEVYQLTTWDTSQGKGIDDFIVGQLRSNGQQKPEDIFASLFAAAKPFIETIEATSHDLALVFSELKKLQIPDLLRDQLARPLAERLGVRVDEIRKIGKEAAKESRDIADADPWPEAVDGALLLDELVAIVAKHIITEDYCKTTLALWIVLASLIDVLDIMPLLAITSPEKRCGKTRLMTLLFKLVRRAFPGVSLTAANVYRIIEKWHPTLLIDEADGILKDSRGNDNTELRNVINSGHTREFAWVPRCAGDNHDVENFSTWSAKAIALIGRMPDSMLDRSIHIPLKRKPKQEKVARIRETSQAVFDELRSKIVRFVQDKGAEIAKKVPTVPPGLNDRAEDCWIPMLAIAEVAGGKWPNLARKAALALSTDGDDADTFVTKLLQALKHDFEINEETESDGFRTTHDICEHLNEDDEAPWSDSTKFKKGLTAELLARKLAPYEVKSVRITVEQKKLRGFQWIDLKPVFDRYL
jgi:putative DNA primase/helicase